MNFGKTTFVKIVHRELEGLTLFKSICLFKKMQTTPFYIRAPDFCRRDPDLSGKADGAEKPEFLRRVLTLWTCNLMCSSHSPGLGPGR
jgi:hypothetical protein